MKRVGRCFVQHDRLPVADATDDASGLPVAVIMSLIVVAIMPVIVATVPVRGVMGMAVTVLMLVMTVMMIMPVMTMVAVLMRMMVVVVMIMPVIMVMVVMTVIVVMAMMVRVLVRRGVAVVRLERRRHRLGLEAAFLQKKRDLRRVGDAQPVGEDLHRHMTVAEREDQPHGLGEILLSYLQHRLDLGDDLDQPAIVEQQQVVGAQQRRRRKVEFDAGALAAEHETLLLDAVFVFEQHGIDDVALRFSGENDFLGARHGMIRFSDASGARRHRP
jgi:hypothetical protein